MADNIQRSTGRPQNYKFDRGGQSAEFGPFVGTVKNNVDPTRSGRLQVYIEQFGGVNPNDKNLWRTVSYCPPFYGSTPPPIGKTGNTNDVGNFIDGNPQSYGMWFTPPDIDTQVMCFFVAGDPNQGFYTGCIPQQGIGHMVPAIGSSDKFKFNNKDQASYFNGAKVLPVTEINPNNQKINDNPKFFDQERPIHSVLAAEMFQQGTLADPKRGPISSSSQRESPSTVFGVSTPGKAVYQGGLTESNIQQQIDSGQLKPQDIRVVGRRGGHSIVMDDGDIEGNDNLVRIRTSKGHQITMSDDGNFFYIIHANGQTWLEFGQEGTVDVFSTNSVNIRTQGTINLHADKDINMFAGGKLNVKAVESINVESDTQINLMSAENLTIYSKTKIGIKADGSLALVSTDGSWNGGGSLVLQAGGIDLNGGAPESVETPTKLQKYVMPESEFDSAIGWAVNPTGLESIVTRAPTHEPWPYHNQGVSVEVAMEEGQPSTPPNTPDVPEGWSGTVVGA